METVKMSKSDSMVWAMYTAMRDGTEFTVRFSECDKVIIVGRFDPTGYNVRVCDKSNKHHSTHVGIYGETAAAYSIASQAFATMQEMLEMYHNFYYTEPQFADRLSFTAL